MRVGIFTDTYLPDINGVVSSILTLKKVLEEHGHDVYVVTNHTSLIESTYENKVLYLTGIEIKKLYGYVMSSPIQFKAYDIVEEWNLDIIHAHTEFGIGLFARSVAKRFNIPLVSTYHTTYEDYTHYVNFLNSKSFEKLAKMAVGKLSKVYTNASITIIAPSLKTKKMLEGYEIKRPLRVIPTGIDLKRFSPNATSKEVIKNLRDSLKIADDELMLLYVGRLAKEKSVDVIINAAKYFDDLSQVIKFVIVGDGPDRENLESLVDENNLTDRVTFIGKIPQDDVIKYYHSADMFISASMTETQGMTYIEALAAGIIVVARKDEAIDDLIIPGHNGYLFSNQDEILNAFEKYINTDNKTKQKMKNDTLDSVIKYSLDYFYNSVEDCYNQAIEFYRVKYEVLSVKSKQDYIEIKLQRNQEDFTFKVSFEFYSEHRFDIGTFLSPYDFDEVSDEHEYYTVYRKFFNKVAAKDRTRKEMYDYLTQKTDLNVTQINEMINDFEEKNYINDKEYVKNYISNVITLLHGKNKIYNDLRRKGIAHEIVEEAFKQEEEYQELSLAIKYAKRASSSIKDKTVIKKRTMIKDKMKRQGFSIDLINEALQQLDFNEDLNKEDELLNKQVAKTLRKYQGKYTGYQLRTRVFNSLISQGFDYHKVYSIINEMEWNDEQEYN